MGSFWNRRCFWSCCCSESAINILPVFSSHIVLKHNPNPQSKSLTHLSHSILTQNPPCEIKLGVLLSRVKVAGTAYKFPRQSHQPNTLEISPKFSTSQWTQADGPQGSTVFDIFATSKRMLYAITPSGIYKLTPDATAWTLTNTSVPIDESRMHMAAHEDTLYIVSADEVYTSTDACRETWNPFCRRPKGHAVGFIVTDEAQGHDSPDLRIGGFPKIYLWEENPPS